MNRRPLIAGNWKMFKGGADGVALATDLARSCGERDVADVVVAPPFTALHGVARALAGSRIGLAAQNVHQANEGAFTGELTAQMLLEAGCSWVIIGHSERRQYFAESDVAVSEKCRASLAAGLKPIVCVGETLEQREGGQTLDVVSRQVRAFVGELETHPGVAAIAYEPIWAIGTGKVAGPEQAQEVHQMIRASLAQCSAQLRDSTRLLYGGSVKPDNAAALLACPDVDGALVGGASLSADSFSAIVHAAG